METMEERIVDAVTKYENEHMALQPSSVSVNLQADALFVMLQGVNSPSVRACAENEESQRLLEEYYARMFYADRQTLDAEIESILGRTVKRSTMRVDCVAGTGVVHFVLGDKT